MSRVRWNVGVAAGRLAMIEFHFNAALLLTYCSETWYLNSGYIKHPQKIKITARK